ncbi:efflux transporter outer membrane subunit [Sphingobacterium mizutaii]|uniref:efflux transporter outer membrane subunit n=1 Tax=Sphingobacterium mizutaii TaxID=1010 RepID=UPI0016264A9A|nr:efflux transporter outer membrane subunit [Sphingobacterium mizutaii]
MKQFKTTVIGLLLLAGLVQSCKVTRDYARPELNLPQSFGGDVTSSVGDSIKEIPDYSAFFRNEELTRLIDSVIKNNYDLQIATENILASQASLRSVKLNYLPDLNLQLNAGFQRLSKNSMTGTFVDNLLYEDYTLGPTVSWEVDFWGKLKRQREEAVADFLGQKEIKRALLVQLIAQTATAYYNLLNLNEQLSITEKVEQLMANTLEILQTQYRVGDVNMLAIKQAEAQLSETRALIPEIKASIKAQENALQTLSGNYPGTVSLTGKLDETAFNSSLLRTGIPADLLANRPDVKQSELLLQAADARVGIAKTSFYPTINITGQGGFNSIRASDWLAIPASLFGNATAGLTQPLFNRRKIKSAYEQAIHYREAAVHSFRKSVVTAVEEVSSALSNIKYTEEQAVEVKNRKKAMQNAIDDAQMLYTYGDANYLEVLTVQQSYLQTEMAHSAIHLKEKTAYITLYKSLGGN